MTILNALMTKIFIFLSILFAFGEAYSQLKINETFETATYPPTGWTETDASDIISRSSGISGFGFGSGSVKADFFNVISGTAVLNTPVFANLTGNDTLVFDYAYAPYTTIEPDSLLIKISTDNGATFSITLAAYQLNNIATAPGTDFEFSPSATQWATIKLKLNSAVTGNNSQIQFYFTSGYGNNLYLDNITLGNSLTADVQALSLENSGMMYFNSSNITPYGRYRNNGTSPATFNVTRTISPGGYSSTKTITGLAAGAISFAYFDPFSFSAGTPYTIKDSVYMAGDSNPANDTLSHSFTPNVAKTILIYYNDAASKDSLVTHLNASAYATYYDVLSMGTYGGSLQPWRSVIVLFGAGVTWNDALRDSMKIFLDNSLSTQKRTLAVFGNDIAYSNDPKVNASASAKDTTFLRQYLRAEYLGDNWLTSIPLASATLKGVNNFSAVTSTMVTDASPDFLKPVNSGIAGFVPFNEDGNKDTAAAVLFAGTDYNMLFCTNLYSKFSTNTNIVFDVIAQWVIDSNGVLPVELQSLTSEIDNNNVTLKWITSSENNNSGFDIERKSGNNNWQRVSFVQGNGTSNTVHSYSYRDKLINTGIYNYRLKQIDYNGNYKYYNLNSDVNIGAPKKFVLKQNYPNPFNPTTNIEYELPNDSKVTINVYDVTGRLAATLVNEIQSAGYYKTQFDAGKLNLASGLYIYQIVSESASIKNVKSMKMMLIK